MNDYLFNYKFTRPDEQNANEYHVGSHILATSREEAEKRLAERNSHLTVLSVELWCVMNMNGDVIERGPNFKPNPE